MFHVIDAGMLVLAVMLAALGVGPGLLALSSRRARRPSFEARAPKAVAPGHGFRFGAATAARC